MVLSLINLYPEYRINSQYDRANPGIANRSFFSGITGGEDASLLRDFLEIRNSLRSVAEEVDRLDTGTGDDTLDVAENTMFATGFIPTIRRLNSIPQNIEDDNWVRPAALAGVAALSLPGDWREMVFAGKDIGNIYRTGGHLSSLAENTAKNQYQHGLSLFKGTFLEHFVEKRKWISNMDKTLFDTNFGRFIRRIFNVEQLSAVEGEGFIYRKVCGSEVPALRFAGGRCKEFIGRALLRTPVLGIALSTALEIPAIIQSACGEGGFMEKAGSVAKQVVKSAGFIGLVQGGITAGSTLAVMAFPPAGAAAALVGMAIGSAGGVMLSQHLNKKIDSAFEYIDQIFA